MKLYTLQLREIVRSSDDTWKVRWRVLASSVSRETIRTYENVYARTHKAEHLRVITGV